MATSQSNKYQGETPENMAEIPASSRNDFGAHHVVDVDSASPNSPKQQRAEHLRFKFTRTPQPFRFILDNGFSFLCLLAYGEKSLHQIWELAHKPERPGEDWTKPLYDRLNTVCILAGLILSTTATFISATPPVPSMFDFNAPGVYGCLLCSYALLLGGLAVGTVTLFVCLKCDQRWFRRMHLSSPSRIVCITIILAYPFLSTLFAIILGAMALFVGVFLRASTLFRVISCLCAIGPFTILALFGWMQLPSQSTLYMDPGDMADSTEKTNAEGNTTLYSLGERTRANA